MTVLQESDLGALQSRENSYFSQASLDLEKDRHKRLDMTRADYQHVRLAKVLAKTTKAKLVRTLCDFLGHHVISTDSVSPQQRR